jgi:hypothetical protein
LVWLCTFSTQFLMPFIITLLLLQLYCYLFIKFILCFCYYYLHHIIIQINNKIIFSLFHYWILMMSIHTTCYSVTCNMLWNWPSVNILFPMQFTVGISCMNCIIHSNWHMLW